MNQLATFTTSELDYIAQLLKFTEKQILLNTGKVVTLEICVPIAALERERKHILSMVARLSDLSYDELISSSRKKEIVHARVIGYAILKSVYAKISLEEIGRLLGGRDHTTVMHMDRIFQEEIENSEFIAQYKIIKSEVLKWHQSK